MILGSTIFSDLQGKNALTDNCETILYYKILYHLTQTLLPFFMPLNMKQGGNVWSPRNDPVAMSGADTGLRL